MLGHRENPPWFTRRVFCCVVVVALAIVLGEGPPRILVGLLRREVGYSGLVGFSSWGSADLVVSSLGLSMFSSFLLVRREGRGGK